MLHILWILIKFILIILGILLGLALLAVLLLLFCPVRYQARAVKETGSFKETELEARITWLFHAVGARFCFHNGEGKLVILLFGVSLETIKGWLKKLKGGRRKNSVSQTSRSKAKKRKKKSAQTKGISQENRTKKPDVKEASGEESNVSNAVAEEKTKQMAESRIETEKKASQPEAHVAENFQDHAPKTEAVLLENITAEPQTGKSSAEKQEENIKSASKSGLFTHIWEILSKIIRFPGNLWNKVISIIKGIIEKIKNITKTISGITDKLGWWKEFLTNERTKAAISLIWKDAKGLLHHVLPTKLEGDVTFGCDDPAITGTVLAVLGMTFPFHKNRIHVNPLFDGENQLTGNVSLKGRIYGIVLIKAAIEIYFNKNIKYVINRWKHKED